MPRRPWSIRHTVTIDTFRPGDILGDTVQIAVGRDLRTGDDGSATVVREAHVRTELAYRDHYRLISVASEPRATSWSRWWVRRCRRGPAPR